MTRLGEQAGVELALGGDPHPRAGAAERRRHRRDHADLAAAVDIAPAAGHLADVLRVDRLQRQHRVDLLHDLPGRDDVIHPPPVGRADVHELDEPQHERRAMEVLRERDDVVVVQAALDHHIDLDRAEADLLGHVDRVQHLGHREVDVVHRAERLIVQRIQRDRDPLQACVIQGLGLDGQGGPVRGQRDVQRLALVGPHGGQVRDQLLDALAQQRFPAGQSDLADAVLHPDPGQAGDLLEREDLRPVHEGVVAAEDLLGHAVDAAEVAPVGDGNPHIAQRPPARVDDPVTHAPQPRPHFPGWTRENHDRDAAHARRLRQTGRHSGAGSPNVRTTRAGRRGVGV